MKYFRFISLLFLVFNLFNISSATTVKRVYAAGLTAYNGGFFTIQKPSGWTIQTAGQCSTFAFLIRDPTNPLRQIFHFGEVYEFENGFYDRYDKRRNQYEMSNLKLLRGNRYDLWTSPTLDGPRHLR